MLIQSPQLNHQQLDALDVLCADCNDADGNQVAIYRHLLGKDRSRPSNILFYQQQNDTFKLTGFLAAFFFHDNACEMALMVAPEFRRQGIASHMLKAILPLLQVEGISRIIISAPHGLNDHWLPVCGFNYQGSEFQMQRTDIAPIPIQDSTSQVRVATELDIPTLCAIDSVCFTSHKANMTASLRTLLNDPNHCLFVITHDNMVVGKAHLHWQPTGARFSDIAILPGSQGRGLGTGLLTHCINHALAVNKPDIVLDVETRNKHALSLYTRLGFSIINAYDYWSIDEFGLTGFLHRI